MTNYVPTQNSMWCLIHRIRCLIHRISICFWSLLDGLQFYSLVITTYMNSYTEKIMEYLVLNTEYNVLYTKFSLKEHLHKMTTCTQSCVLNTYMYLYSYIYILCRLPSYILSLIHIITICLMHRIWLFLQSYASPYTAPTYTVSI